MMPTAYEFILTNNTIHRVRKGQNRQIESSCTTDTIVHQGCGRFMSAALVL